MKKLFLILLMLSASGHALAKPDFQRLATGHDGSPAVDLSISQSGGMTLSQAVDSIRRRGDVERIVSAETKVQGNKEVHHIRYMTKDGKVRTAKVPGRRR